MQKFILLGASRGLGWETYLQLAANRPSAEFILSSRKISGRAAEVTERTVLLEQDFSKSPLNTDFIRRIQQFNGDCLIYFAGGGPYGNFQSKKWSDHQWALQTSFLYPAELTHHILANKSQWPDLKKLVIIGSSVAEAQGDPMAASYSAAKHALRGLVDSVNAEQKPRPALLLFSPGYMQTDLLPANSGPRAAQLAENPKVVAERLIEFIENPAE